jgi:glycosyltransferase involved in cell wall biosynthesis
MEDLVSVIVPAYNSGVKIKSCISSILKSTYDSLEVIVVDDGSSEADACIYDSLQELSEKVKIIHQENTGVSGARNTGIDNAHGKFITFVDADDTIDSELISTLVENCKKNKSDVSICGYKEFYDETNYMKFSCKKKKELIDSEILECFFTSNIIGWSVWAKLYSKAVIGETRFKVGRKTAEDMFFVYEVLKKARKVIIDNRLLYNYIKQSDSAMADTNCEKFFDTFDLINEIYLDRLSNPKIKKAQSEFYLSKMLWFFRFIIYKDKKNNYKKQIQNARSFFLRSIKIDKIKCNKKQAIELFLFEYMYPVYKILVLGVKYGQSI